MPRHMAKTTPVLSATVCSVTCNTMAVAAAVKYDYEVNYTATACVTRKLDIYTVSKNAQTLKRYSIYSTKLKGSILMTFGKKTCKRL